MLELGCAGGGNLLPFALACPQVYDVVGGGPFIDADVGLAECESACHEPDGITPEFGRFDYIVAHGVFSCVPPEVREVMMRILRDAMLLHSHGAETEDEKLARAKSMLNSLSECIASNNSLTCAMP